MKVYGRSDSDKGRASSRFQEAYRQIGGFRRETKVSTWSIARHLTCGHLRKTKCRHDEKHETIEFLRADQADASAVTLDAVETSERKRIVHDALQELPEHYRRVVQRCDLEEKSTAETVTRPHGGKRAGAASSGPEDAPRPPLRADGVRTVRRDIIRQRHPLPSLR